MFQKGKYVILGLVLSFGSFAQYVYMPGPSFPPAPLPYPYYSYQAQQTSSAFNQGYNEATNAQYTQQYNEGFKEGYNRGFGQAYKGGPAVPAATNTTVTTTGAAPGQTTVTAAPATAVTTTMPTVPGAITTSYTQMPPYPWYLPTEQQPPGAYIEEFDARACPILSKSCSCGCNRCPNGYGCGH